MGVKRQDVYDLIDRFEAGSASRMKVSWEGLELELEKGAPAPAACPGVPPLAPGAPLAGQMPAAYPVATPYPAAVPGAAPAASAPEASAALAPSPEAPATADGPCITAPLVGTFYVAPAPDKDPYVQPGDEVKRGDTVCLLEAMKMMSEVTAPCDCVIEEIVAADGELVSFGAPLIRYREL